MALPHALVLPLPLQGHMNPMLYLLRRLSSTSLFTLLVLEADVPRVRASIGEEPRIRVIGIPPSVLDLGRLRSIMSAKSQLMALLELLESAKDGIVELVRGLGGEGVVGAPVTCVLADLFICMAQDVANELGVPRVCLWTSSAASVVVVSQIKKLIQEGILPPKDMEDVELTVPGIPGLRKSDLPQSLLDANHKELETRMKIASRIRDAACVLVNTVTELEPRVMEAIESTIHAKVIPVGPLFHFEDVLDKQQLMSPGGGRGAIWEEDMQCLDWLDKQAPRSVLYVSFGSMAMLSAAQVEELARGLELSEQRFLWVIRPNLAKDLSQEFVASFVERTKDRGMVISWAPQPTVLKHKSVGGFLTHCGWNSTLEAVLSGVPMLGWPCFAEQQLNCKFIVDEWKVGLGFSKRQDGLRSSTEVDRVVRLLMLEDQGREMRSRCQELGAKVISKVKASDDFSLEKVTRSG